MGLARCLGFWFGFRALVFRDLRFLGLGVGLGLGPGVEEVRIQEHPVQFRSLEFRALPRGPKVAPFWGYLIGFYNI